MITTLILELGILILGCSIGIGIATIIIYLYEYLNQRIWEYKKKNIKNISIVKQIKIK